MTPDTHNPAMNNNIEIVPTSFWKRDGFFVLSVVLVTLAIAYTLARIEVVSRAKNAYLEGEKYWSWYQKPAEKKVFFDGELKAGRINQDAYNRLIEDSDIKMAYTWYMTVTDLFQPPRSQWVLKAEERLKTVKPLRDQWMRSIGVEPVE